jgi:hypothetical protein
MIDAFDDLPAEVVRKHLDNLARGPAEAKRRRQRGKRAAEEFFYVPVAWVYAAGDALTNIRQLLAALELYRRWKMRRKGVDAITAGSRTLGGADRNTRQRTLQSLDRAGLIKIVSKKPGQASLIRVVERRR